jgi:hypothetical protein
VCVCISESGRNKTQLAGKKDSPRGEKTLAKLASKFKKLLANSKFHLHLVSWWVVICTPGSEYKFRYLHPIAHVQIPEVMICIIIA